MSKRASKAAFSKAQLNLVVANEALKVATSEFEKQIGSLGIEYIEVGTPDALAACKTESDCDALIAEDERVNARWYEIRNEFDFAKLNENVLTARIALIDAAGQALHSEGRCTKSQAARLYSDAVASGNIDKLVEVCAHPFY